MTLQNFLKSHAAKVETIETASHRAWWNLATTGEDHYAQEFAAAKIALRTLYSNRKDYQFLSDQPASTDPLIRRQQTLLLHQYRENQIPPELIQKIAHLETEIESTYTKFRPVVEGREISNNDLKTILVQSTNSAERQHAWEASKLIGEKVAHKVRELIILRNQSAEIVDFPDYYTMRLELQELDQDSLFALLDQLEESTQAHWERYKQQLDQALASRYGITEQQLMPWHYQDPFFQEAPTQALDLDLFFSGKDIVEISSDFYRAIGMPVDDVLARSDLFERDKKHPHAFCSCIDRKQDIRILCNLRDNEYWMATQLHELGHAVYDKYIDQSLPYLLRAPPHISTTEASAMLFGRLGNSGEFLQRYVGVPAETAQAIEPLAKQQTAAKLLVFARWALVMIHFERAMYQEPAADLNRLWWTYVQRYQNVQGIPQRNHADWASKLHLACAPVYYQNYVLGELTASQLLHRLRGIAQATQQPMCESRHTGEFLREKLYSLGARYPWDHTLLEATGETLNPDYFSQDVQAAAPENSTI